jgi:hypothetical protein
VSTMCEEKILQAGDLVRLAATDSILGIVIYKHPAKDVVRVYWSDDMPSWESCSRLRIISSFDSHKLCLPR